MSKLEIRIQEELKKHNVNFETQKPVPLDNYPWKTSRSITSPKSDIYLTDFDIHIEVKGFMTFRAVSKLSYLSRQNYKYYIFQGTESQWDCKKGSFIVDDNRTEILSEGKTLEKNIKHQIEELINLKNNPSFVKNISNITLERLKKYIEIKIDEYKDWNNEWY